MPRLAPVTITALFFSARIVMGGLINRSSFYWQKHFRFYQGNFDDYMSV
jgi:hypothetical protein